MSRIHGHYHGALTFLSITDNLLQSATVDWMQYSVFSDMQDLHET